MLTAILVVMVLAELGFNILPVVASASIIGVVLGFGAQTLVKDFLAGVFMIFEDQYGVGDLVDMEKATGVVEAVGLRVTRLRGEDGTTWYVRNGEVLRVGNLTTRDPDAPADHLDRRRQRRRAADNPPALGQLTDRARTRRTAHQRPSVASGGHEPREPDRTETCDGAGPVSQAGAGSQYCGASGGEGDVQGDGGAGQGLGDRAVLLGVLGELGELVRGQARRPCRSPTARCR